MTENETCDTYVAPASCNETNPPTFVPTTSVPSAPPLPETGGMLVDPVSALGFALLLMALGLAAFHVTPKTTTNHERSTTS